MADPVRLPPGVLRVLAAVMEDPHPTIRGLGRRLNQTGFGWIQRSLHRLRVAGLIAFEEGIYGTIRPTCRFIPADALESEAWKL